MKTKIETLYQQYLCTVQLDEQKMSATQQQELRRAFFGGVSTLLRLIIEAEEDDLSEDFLTEIFKQCKDFWNTEMTKHQAKNNLAMNQLRDILAIILALLAFLAALVMIALDWASTAIKSKP